MKLAAVIGWQDQMPSKFGFVMTAASGPVMPVPNSCSPCVGKLPSEWRRVPRLLNTFAESAANVSQLQRNSQIRGCIRPNGPNIGLDGQTWQTWDGLDRLWATFDQLLVCVCVCATSLAASSCSFSFSLLCSSFLTNSLFGRIFRGSANIQSQRVRARLRFPACSARQPLRARCLRVPLGVGTSGEPGPTFADERRATCRQPVGGVVCFARRRLASRRGALGRSSAMRPWCLQTTCWRRLASAVNLCLCILGASIISPCDVQVPCL